jgi:hypothetical protein
MNRLLGGGNKQTAEQQHQAAVEAMMQRKQVSPSIGSRW